MARAQTTRRQKNIFRVMRKKQSLMKDKLKIKKR